MALLIIIPRDYRVFSTKKTTVASATVVFVLVGVRRLELPTPCPPDMCASQLRHTPINGGAKLAIHLIFSNTPEEFEMLKS
jgi:hypothetical protein